MLLLLSILKIFWKVAFTKVWGNMHSVLDQKTQSAPYVRMFWLLEDTTDTIDITGIPPHTNLLAKNERLKCIIGDCTVSVTRDMKRVLKYEPEVREISEPGFIQTNLILSKLDEIITHNKVTTNQSIFEREEHALHLIEYIVSSKNYILIFF